MSANLTDIAPNVGYYKLNYNTRDHDSTNSFDTSAYRYNVPASGRYNISIIAAFGSTNVLNNLYELYIYKNGALHSFVDRAVPAVTTSFCLKGSMILNLLAGDYIEIYLYGAGNNGTNKLVLAGTSTASSVSFHRIGY